MQGFVMRKLRSYTTAAVLGGATLGGWIGYGTGIGHVALNGKDASRAYHGVVEGNIIT
jgi:hypothetical protein